MEHYKDEYGVLYNTDCFEIFEQIEDNSFDLILTDPPYGVIGTNNGYRQKWDTFSTEEEYLSFTKKWLKECYRILKEGGQMYVFWSQKKMFEFKPIVEEAGFNLKRVLIWHHTNLLKPTNRMYVYSYDPIFYLIKGDKPNYFMSSFLKKHNRDVFIFPKPQNWKNRKRLHPAEKPLELCKILIQNSTKEGHTVLDPFAGSGTTILACKLLKRKYTGIEINKEYYEIAIKRLKGEIKY